MRLACLHTNLPFIPLQQQQQRRLKTPITFIFRLNMYVGIILWYHKMWQRYVLSAHTHSRWEVWQVARRWILFIHHNVIIFYYNFNCLVGRERSERWRGDNLSSELGYKKSSRFKWINCCERVCVCVCLWLWCGKSFIACRCCKTWTRNLNDLIIKL